MSSLASLLSFRDSEGGHVAFPGWAAFLWRLGEQLAQHDRGAVQLVLPTRSYAAPLIAAGFCLASHKPRTVGIADFPVGTNVITTHGKKQVRAVVTSHASFDGTRGLWVSWGDGGRGFVPERGILSRIRLEGDGHAAANNYGSAVRKIVEASPLLRAILPDADAYLRLPTTEAAILGTLNALQPEVYAQHISAKGSDGVLDDVLQTRANTPRTELSGIAGAVISPSVRLIIADGLRAFHAARSYGRTRLLVAIINRAAPDFDDALSFIEASWAERPKGALPLSMKFIPGGIEFRGASWE